MTVPALPDRLAALPGFPDLPREELEWLSRHGELCTFEPGTVIARRGERIEYIWIILSGHISVHRDTAAGRRRVISWTAGDVTGMLPYSRMAEATTDIRLDEPTETLRLHERLRPEIVSRCPGFTAYTVHLMVDRARRFKATELQAEKLVSLGRLAAGLAHELNNPASATARGAALLGESLAETEAAARALFGAGVPESSFAVLESVRAAALGDGGGGVLSALERADREAELEDWLLDHGCDPDHALALSETAVSVAELDRLVGSVPAELLDRGLRWMAASAATRSVAADIEGAARRIHELVAAVKRFTYMDNLTGDESVDVGSGLRDTVTVLAAKARGKNASVRIDVPADLPRVRGRGSELNQVWMNLVDNALDAVHEGGRVEIGAERKLDRVEVRVVDDGPGISDEVAGRIFDPFFTTKGPGDGTGLGLDIARRIVNRNHGEIDVESRPGRTEFRVRLPVDDASEGSPASPTVEAP